MPLFMKKLLGIMYGIYAWTVFVLVVVSTTLLVAVTPGLGVRRSMARGAARLIFACTGMPLTVRTVGRLPDGACVIVSNHASFLDGAILTGALPPRFSFVIKNEMKNAPITGLLLRRLGSEFVERSDRHKGASDARRIMRAPSRRPDRPSQKTNVTASPTELSNSAPPPRASRKIAWK